MKLTFTLLLAFASCTLLRAQTTLSAVTHLQPPGAVVITYQADTSGIDEGPSGANVTWDYSTITGNGMMDTATYVLPGVTPFSSSFPGANLAFMQIATGSFTYYNAGTSGIDNLGEANPLLQISYSDPKQEMQFPFAFGDAFNDSYSGSYYDTTFGLTVDRSGYITVDADAWGTLDIQGNVFSNVLRVHTTDLQTDSMSIFGFPIVTMTLRDKYEYYDASSRASLFRVEYMTIGTAMGGTTTKSVTSTVPITASGRDEDLMTSADISIYPNPSAGIFMVEVSADNQDAEIMVSDLNGRIVKSDFLGNLSAGDSRTLDLGELAPGIYLLTFRSKAGVRIEKIVKQ